MGYGSGSVRAVGHDREEGVLMSVRVVVSVIIVAVVLSLIATFLVRAQEPVVKIRPPAPVPEILIDSTFCKQKMAN